MPTPVNTTEPALLIEKCSKTYANGFKAVKNVSFSVAPGDFTVLLGLNGAGKTSLISMITSLNTISSGHIKIFGYDTVKESFHAKRLLGVMPQEINFNPFLSVIDTLIFYGGYYGISKSTVYEAATPLLKKARLWKKKDELVSNLSGGMRRMVMLIRTLIASPKIVILDEPTANLDIEIREIIWNLLRDLQKKGVSVLLTTHNLEEAQALCDKIVIIHHGKIVLNHKIKDAITQLKEQFFTLSFRKKPKDLSFLDAHSYRFIDDHHVTLKITNDTKLSDVLSRFHHEGVEYYSVAPTNNQLEQILKEAIV